MLKVGDKAPELKLFFTGGKGFSLENHNIPGFLVLFFYGGNEDTISPPKLKAFEKQLNELSKHQCGVLAISTDILKRAKITEDKLLVSFPILSNLSEESAKEYGLIFDDNTGHYLPALFLINSACDILYSSITTNSNDQLPSPQSIITILKRHTK